MSLTKFKNFLTYKKYTRLSLIDKNLILNTFLLPSVQSASVFLDLKLLEDYDNSRLLASMFFLRLICNRKPYVSRFGLFQTFLRKEYDALVKVDLRGKILYEFLETLSLGILPFLSKTDFDKRTLKTPNGVVVNFSILDLSFLRVVETHSAFFK